MPARRRHNTPTEPKRPPGPAAPKAGPPPGLLHRSWIGSRWNWFQITAFFSIAGLLFLGSGGLVIAHVEDNSAFCASCHTQPESNYYQRTQDTTPVDLASAHAGKNVTCIECHSGAGATGRLGAMMVGAKDLTAFISRNYHDPAIVTVPISDEYCLKCHAAVTARQDFNNHFHVFLPKWQKLDPAHAATCVDCHQAHVTGGLTQAAFLQEAPTTAICQKCHTFAGAGN